MVWLIIAGILDLLVRLVAALAFLRLCDEVRTSSSDNDAGIAALIAVFGLPGIIVTLLALIGADAIDRFSDLMPWRLWPRLYRALRTYFGRDDGWGY